MKNETIIRQCAQTRDSFYLYDEAVIARQITRLKRTFPGAELLYSIKCNPNPHVLNCLFRKGFGADAASEREVEMACQAGLTPGGIQYSAPGKGDRDLLAAWGKATFIADSVGEMHRIQTIAQKKGQTVSVGLRVNPNFTFAGEGGIPSKFGIDAGEALALAKENPFPNLRIAGIHVHVKSQELRENVLSAYHKNVFRLAEKFAGLLGGLDFVNLGSGLGIPYGVNDREPDLTALGTTFAEHLAAFRQTCPKTRVILETGRFPVGQSGLYITRVIDRKTSRGKTFLILHNTLNGFLRPSLVNLVMKYAGTEHSAGTEPLFTSPDAFRFLPLKEGEPCERVTLVGNLCTAADVMAEDILLPRLEPGDLIAVTNAGSYGTALSPMQFSMQDAPDELFLTCAGEVLTNRE